MSETKQISGLMVHYRPGTSDENVLREVIDKHVYRRVSANFDVKRGERWLDLGANIGAFAIYSKLHGAEVHCVEPDRECFELLQLNAPWAQTTWAAVVPCSTLKSVELFASPRATNKAAGTIIGQRLNRVETRAPIKLVSKGIVPTIWAGDLDEGYDGIKMDIEGAEGGLLDDWRLPIPKKLVMEYHLSVDNSVANLFRRIGVLKSKFKHVAYPPEFDRAIASGNTTFKSFFDRLIWAWN